ncbi:MAG: hypothetical protein JW724_06580 [Candidatus Altiarchaeota archaeon]|nr:hypothetical protein [Candidatus Altiarchaeota archaeon]
MAQIPDLPGNMEYEALAGKNRALLREKIKMLEKKIELCEQHRIISLRDREILESENRMLRELVESMGTKKAAKKLKKTKTKTVKKTAKTKKKKKK